MNKYYLFIGALTIFVITLIGFSISVVGTPFAARAQELDRQRIQDFSAIKQQVNDYYYKNQSLPTKLAGLSNSIYGSFNTKDPETKKEYEYKVVSQTSYNLCTTFSTEVISVDESLMGRPLNYYGPQEPHKKGYDCILTELSQASNYVTKTTSITPKQFEDTHIKTVNSDAQHITYSQFPYGFFSSSESEWGLINYDTKPVIVTVTFNKPETLVAITNRFTHCPAQDCYTWSAQGIKEDGTKISLVKSTIAQSDENSTMSVTTEEKLTGVILTGERNSGGSVDYVHWQKITFGYN